MQVVNHEMVGIPDSNPSFFGSCNWSNSSSKEITMSLDDLKLLELCIKAFFGIIGCFSGGLLILFGIIYGIEALKRRANNGHNSRTKNS